MRVESLVAKLWPGAQARIEPLGGGITNHNFKVTAGGEAFALRVAGRDTALLGIDRRVEHLASLAAAELGIGPEVVAFLEEDECLVTRFVEGDVAEAERMRDPEAAREVGAALARFHAGPPLPAGFDAFRIVERYRETALAHGGEMPAAYDRAQALARRIEAALGPRPRVPCHNDLLNANFIAAPDGLRIVDWEYAGMGDPFFDLGNFAANHDLPREAEDALLAAALGAEPGDADRARLHAFRVVSELREAMWGVVQAAVSELDVDFAAYAGDHFAKLEREAAGLDEALAVLAAASR